MTKSTRSGWSAPARAVVLTMLASLTLVSCATAVEVAPQSVRTTTPLDLHVGVLVPTSGSLAGVAPSMRAGIEVAIAEINESGTGMTISAEYRDSGDSTTETGIASATELIDLGVDAIVGPLSDGVARKVITPITRAGIVQISPGTRSPDFARADDGGLYWRTAASCALEGEVLAAEAARDGNTSVAIIHESDFCGPEIAAGAAIAFERGGGKSVVQSTFAANDGSIATAITEATADAPSAVVVLAAQSKEAIAPLIAAGFEGEQLYLSGLGAADFTADFAPDALTRATTSVLGPGLPATFSDRLVEFDPAISDWRYAAESYDAVMVLALASLVSQSTSGDKIAAELQAVSGGIAGGTPCDTFEDCADLVVAGEQPDYDGPSGAISFDKAGDASGAAVRLFRFDASNVAESLER